MLRPPAMVSAAVPEAADTLGRLMQGSGMNDRRAAANRANSEWWHPGDTTSKV